MQIAATPRAEIGVNRAGLFAFLAVLLLVNSELPLAAQDVAAEGLWRSGLNLFAVGLVFYVAGFAFITVARAADDEPVRPLDWLAAVVVSLLALVPLHWFAKSAFVPLAAYALATSPRESPVWRIGVVAATFVGGAFLLSAFAEPILALDATIVRAVTGSSGYGNVVDTDFVPGSNQITHVIILEACSSLKNLSQATILWASLTQMFRTPITRPIVLAGIAAGVAVVATNVVRIAAIVRFPQYYEWLHHGPGATLFGLASLVACGAILCAAILHASQPRRA
ncbi:exosortase/archaeosortase family protein [Sphingomonas sp. ASV193]|uniref:exosortase/archaeosortase family protein n=1 Tax=Sphingomonas sp. ASV193 TaxID=3144405 RepID=UPI0032E8FB5F